MKDALSPKIEKRIALVMGSIFHFFHDGIADGLAVFLPMWQASFGLSLTSVGLMVTCFEGPAGLFQLPAGFLGERYGERTILVVGSLVTAVCFLCISIAGGLASLILVLLIGGIGSSVQHPLASSMVSKAYGASGRRAALGAYNFSGDFGKFVFPALAAVCLSMVHWRTVSAGLGLLVGVLTLSLYIVLKKTNIGSSEYSSKKKNHLLRTNGWGIHNKRAFGTLSVIGFLDTAVRIGVVSFGPFLFIEKGIKPESVGFVLALLFFGGAFGKLVCGLIAERSGAIGTILVTEGITAVGIIILTMLPLPLIYVFLPVLGAALSGTSSVLYGTVADLVENQRIALAFGIFYTCVISAAAIAPPIMGKISDLLGVEASIRWIGIGAFCILPLTLLLSRQSGKPRKA